MSSTDAAVMYQKFLEILKSKYSAVKIKDGVFQAYMTVNISNDGPTTIVLDSK